MGVNIFAPINKCDATLANVVTLVDAANAFGAAHDAFDWCDLFKGKQGHLLSLEDALAFEPDASPWFVLLPQETLTGGGVFAGEFFWCADEARFANNQSERADWQALLRESGCDSVLFMKARL